jgi:hypothetical protein
MAASAAARRTGRWVTTVPGCSCTGSLNIEPPLHGTRPQQCGSEMPSLLLQIGGGNRCTDRHADQPQDTIRELRVAASG